MKIINVAKGNFRREAADMVDQIADAARLSVVVDAARIKEYERAEEQAKAFKAANYEGEPPTSVKAWMDAKQWDAQTATDDIIAASVRWYAALDAIRAMRLKAKEDIKRAASVEAVDVIVATFRIELQALMAGVD